MATDQIIKIFHQKSGQEFVSRGRVAVTTRFFYVTLKVHREVAVCCNNPVLNVAVAMGPSTV